MPLVLLGSRATRQLALPTGTTELVINLHQGPLRVDADVDDTQGTKFYHGVICGTQSKYFVLDRSDNVSVAGVHFRPGGAAHFLGMPLSELTDQLKSPLSYGGTGLAIHLHVGNADVMAKQAVEAGATMVRELKDDVASVAAGFAIHSDTNGCSDIRSKKYRLKRCNGVTMRSSHSSMSDRSLDGLRPPPCWLCGMENSLA
ncbi:MAG: DUF6597 domain-containing transcriptional factor [Acidobacteriota bacterium]